MLSYVDEDYYYPTVSTISSEAEDWCQAEFIPVQNIRQHVSFPQKALQCLACLPSGFSDTLGEVQLNK